VAWGYQTSDQEVLHTGEKDDQGYDRVLGEAYEPAVRLHVLVIIHGLMAIRNIDTHVFISPDVAE
jgi:hypothetical protein